MGLLDLLLVDVGLSMDVFAVSVCKGLNTKMHPVKTGLASIIPNQNNFGITTVLAIPHDGGSGRHRGTESL